MSHPTPDSSAIARELAALGEDPPSPEELASLADPGALEQGPEIASVALLAQLAEPLPFGALSELETHRVWRRVEGQIAQGTDERPATGAAPHNPKRWLYAAFGVAAAATLTLIFAGPQLGLLGDPEGADESGQAEAPSAEELAALGDQARVVLKTLDDGKSETQRAAELLADYERRMNQEGG